MSRSCRRRTSAPSGYGSAWVFLAGLAVLAAGCNGQQEAVPTPPPVVTMSQPVVRDVTDYKTFNGKIESPDSVEVRAQVSGYLVEIKFVPGAEVKKGDVLFVIDRRPYKAALDQTEGALERSEAAFKGFDAEYRRGKGLVGTRALSQQEFEKIEANRGEAAGTVAVNKAKLAQAKLDYEWTEVRAPIAGQVGRNLISVGNLVTAKVTLLTTIVAQDPMYAYFNVDERTVLQIQEQMRKGKLKSYKEAAYPVFLGLANEAGYPHRGTIDFVNNQVDPGTGTLSVRGLFPNKDHILAQGLFARIKLPIGGAHEALLVSDACLGTNQGQKYVLVVGKDRTVEYRPVTPGAMHRGLRVIDEGLKKTDWVIVTGLQRVQPGVTVDAKKVTMPVAPGADAADGRKK